jgi:hypothetical protein
MRLALKLHPDSPRASHVVEVEVARAGAELALTYFVSGETRDIVLPEPAPPTRRDELWRRTCFEAFARPHPGEAYFEFNLAPSGEWAAYRFEGYRQGMCAPEDIAAPAVETRRAPGRFELAARIALPFPGPARLGLSAVIETANGARSCWALAHPPGKPDFHHARAFVLDLPPGDLLGDPR